MEQLEEQRRGRLFAYGPVDAIPVAFGVLHFLFIPALFWAFPHLSAWALVALGLVYAVSVSWNINGISHNFIHNPYFRSEALNRAFSLMESLSLGFSQRFYECVHQRHHLGNSDKPDEEGDTLDWLSIYRHGDHGEPENVWKYTFLSYFRDDPRAIYREIARRNRADAVWGVLEIVAFLSYFVLLGFLNWKFMAFFLPFYYLGHCLSYLNGYFEHYAAKPDVPIAWGVSTYHKIYNWTWFNNGYHAEHHFRPKLHWTKMREFRDRIRDEQRKAGVRVIRPPHALGFLDKDLPRPSSSRTAVATR